MNMSNIQNNIHLWKSHGGKESKQATEAWKKKMKVMFVEDSEEDVVGAVFGAGGAVGAFPGSMIY